MVDTAMQRNQPLTMSLGSEAVISSSISRSRMDCAVALPANGKVAIELLAPRIGVVALPLHQPTRFVLAIKIRSESHQLL